MPSQIESLASERTHQSVHALLIWELLRIALPGDRVKSSSYKCCIFSPNKHWEIGVSPVVVAHFVSRPDTVELLKC